MKRLLRVNLLLLVVNISFVVSIYILLDYAVIRDKNNIVKAGVVNHINELYYKKVFILNNIPESLLSDDVKKLIKEYAKKTKFSLGNIEWQENTKAKVNINIFSYDIGRVYVKSIKDLEKRHNVKLNKENKISYKEAINKEFEKNLKLLTTTFIVYSLDVEIKDYSIYNNYIDIQTSKLYETKIEPNDKFNAIYMNNLGFIDYVNRKE